MGVASASDASMLTPMDVSSIDGQESPHHLAEKEAAAQAKRDVDKDKDKNELMLDQAAPADDDKDKDEPMLDQAVLPAEACSTLSISPISGQGRRGQGQGQ